MQQMYNRYNCITVLMVFITKHENNILVQYGKSKLQIIFVAKKKMNIRFMQIITRRTMH